MKAPHTHTNTQEPEALDSGTPALDLGAEHSHEKKNFYTHERENKGELEVARGVELLEGGAVGLEAMRIRQGLDYPIFYGSPRRQERARIGAEGEERVAALLSSYGHVTHGIPIQSSGTGGYPDLTLKTSRAFYAVEVKSVQATARKNVAREAESVNDVKLKRTAWEAMSSWASGHGLVPMLAVEIRIPGSSKGPLYHLLEGQIVDVLMGENNADWLHISLYDLPALARYSIRPGGPNARRPDL